MRQISRELDGEEGDVMVWQYGAAEALNYICVLHGGDERVAWTIVSARYEVTMFWFILGWVELIGVRSRRRAVRMGRLSVRSIEVVLAYASARASGAI